MLDKFNSKMRCVTCENKINGSIRFVIHRTQQSFYINFAVKNWTLLPTLFAQWPSIFPVFTKSSFFCNIDEFSMYQHRKKEQEIHKLGNFACEDFVYLCGVM